MRSSKLMTVVGLAALGGLAMTSGIWAKSSPKVDAELEKMDGTRDGDSDGDGGLSAAEHMAASKAMFDRMDSDSDGFVSKGDLATGHARLTPRSGH